MSWWIERALANFKFSLSVLRAQKREKKKKGKENLRLHSWEHLPRFVSNYLYFSISVLK
jgi:hypothetical protein